VGSYQIIRRLASGGMAEVFLGKRVGAEGFEKPVAIKRMLPGLAADPESAEAFLREARICVYLVHPNVVQVLDLGTAAGQPYLVMELVDGADLRRVLNEAEQAGLPLGPPEAIYIAALVADALAYAYDAVGPKGEPLSIVHRDVNPSNVLLSMTGEVKLADFGVAKVTDGTSSSQGNLLKGKVGYLAPELLRGAPVQHSSDIFLNGVLLYETLAGRPLFGQGQDAAATLSQIVHHDENKLELPPGSPVELGPILRKALAADPANRYGHARELAEALHSVLQKKGWRVGRESIARRMNSLFPGRIPLDRDMGEGVPLDLPPAPAPAAPAPPAKDPAPLEFDAPTGGKKRRGKLRLGELLIEAGLINESQLQTLLARQRIEGGKLGEWAANLSYAPSKAVLQVLARQLNVSFITDERLLEVSPPDELLSSFPQNLALRLLALPVAERDGTAFVAMTEPTNLERLDLIRFRLGGKVTPIVCTESGVRRAIARVYGGGEDDLKWRQLDAVDPMELITTTRVIDFEAQERELAERAKQEAQEAAAWASRHSDEALRLRAMAESQLGGQGVWAEVPEGRAQGSGNVFSSSGGFPPTNSLGDPVRQVPPESGAASPADPAAKPARESYLFGSDDDEDLPMLYDGGPFDEKK